MEVDLHVHTTASDGVFMPSEVVRIAANNGVRAIAITDHDSVNGIEEALIEADNYDIKVIPGIELSTVYEDTEVHMLGYFVDYKEKWFIDFLDEIKSTRYERGSKIVSKLNEVGVSVQFEDIIKNADLGNVGRPHIARALVDKGYAKDIGDAFSKYLVKGTPGYIERQKITTSEAIKIIRKANGVPVLAHPGLIHSIDLNELILELKAEGLMGLEVYHSSHDMTVTKNIYKLAIKHRLAVTGGSDFHGDMEARNNYRKGRGRVELGCVGITMDSIETLEKLSKEVKNKFEVGC